MGSDNIRKHLIIPWQRFNPRSHMGSDSSFRIHQRRLCSFNPRSHMGSDLPQLSLECTTIVSIHAPTWGATMSSITKYPIISVSIHAPTWGATHGTCEAGQEPSFNPRSHMGSDLPWDMLSRGASRFNPRSHMVSDLLTAGGCAFGKFQSTLPHGERPR